MKLETLLSGSGSQTKDQGPSFDKINGCISTTYWNYDGPTTTIAYDFSSGGIRVEEKDIKRVIAQT